MDITNNKSRQNTYHTTQTRTSPSNGKKNMRMDQKRGNKTTKKKEQTNMRRRWNYLHRQQDLCSKKQTTLR